MYIVPKNHSVKDVFVDYDYGLKSIFYHNIGSLLLKESS